KKKARNHRRNEITKGIFTVLEKEPKKSFNYKQIASKLGITDTQDRNTLIKRLGQLRERKRIMETDRGSYRALDASKTNQTGTVDITGRGNAYVIIEGMDEDVFVPLARINKAFHKDKVEIRVFPKRNGRKLEGEIVAVLERYKMEFVGIVDLLPNFAFVRPRDNGMYTDIFVPKERLKGQDIEDGDKVIVEITDWPDEAESPYGKIKDVLGTPGEHHTEIHAILAEYGLPYEFPADVQRFSEELDTGIKEEEIAKRRDMRQDLTFTIDPKDAKDFDDALSFTRLDNGNFEIGIHIADVSHYLEPDTLLDDEAYDRATSVYLVDRVVPMLPEILSNNACSLRPREEKYTFSAIFEMDAQARLKKQWFGRTVINSDERFAYEEAQHIIETGETRIPESISIRDGSYEVQRDVADAILILNDLAILMRERRMEQGAISFDKIEVKFHLSDDNEPEGVYFKEAKEANKLIEEFMLLANRKVAEFIGKQKPKKSFVYRVHDDPDEEKLMALNGIVSRFGHQLNFKDKKSINSSLNQLLVDVKGKKEQNLVDTLAIRSMSKEIYTTENI
ncbi:MAG: RNB domain-containing ribonuclease, partial [Bacteroidota bacterium]